MFEILDFTTIGELENTPNFPIIHSSKIDFNSVGIPRITGLSKYAVLSSTDPITLSTMHIHQIPFVIVDAHNNVISGFSFDANIYYQISTTFGDLSLPASDNYQSCVTFKHHLLHLQNYKTHSKLLFHPVSHAFLHLNTLKTIFHAWTSTITLSPIGLVDKTDIISALNFLFIHSDSDSDSPLDNNPTDTKKFEFIPNKSFLFLLSRRVIDAASHNPKHLHYDSGAIAFLKGIWVDIILVIKDCWKNGLLIPGVDIYTNGILSIDYRTCLLHQKLSMLNICIFYKKKTMHERPIKDISELLIFQKPSMVDVISDTFLKISNSPIQDVPSRASIDQSWINIEESTNQNDILGRKTPFDGNLWVPETLDSSFMTEDMLNEQQTHFELLGASEDGTRARAKLQSLQLFSDMQAFKAANPSCTLSDFVRWHSPRDWIINDKTGIGELSERMSKDNIWSELWESAKAIPASLQKPLFDYEKHGLDVIQYLESLSVHDILQNLLPTLVLMAFEPFDKDESEFTALRIKLKEFMTMWYQVPWKSIGIEDSVFLDDILSVMREIEDFSIQRNYLIQKLPNQHDLIERLITEKEGTLLEEYELVQVCNLEPMELISKEYIWYSEKHQPLEESRGIKQRVYVLEQDGSTKITSTVGMDGLWF